MRWASVLVLLCGASCALGCRSAGDGRASAGASCRGPSDCAEGLACVEGACRNPSASKAPPLTPLRIEECKSLIAVINTESAKFGQHQPETPVELLRMADAIKGSAKRIGEVKLSDAALVGLRDDYKAMAEDLAKAARDAGTAGTDSDKLDGALKTMDTIGAREDRLLGKINRHCGIG